MTLELQFHCLERSHPGTKKEKKEKKKKKSDLIGNNHG
jgi:hypothetical protein